MWALALMAGASSGPPLRAQKPDPAGVAPASVASSNFLSKPAFPKVLLPYSRFLFPRPQ
jgi:hypothetical protein